MSTNGHNLNVRASSWSDLAENFGAAWNRFWFTPADPLSCAVLRIAVGLLAALHFLDLAGGLSWWYASDGLLPPETVRSVLELASETGASYRTTYLNGFAAGWELWVLHVLAIVAALAFAAGLVTRISGVITLVALLSYVHRSPLVAGHVEPVLSFLLAYLILAPSGARLSIDRWLANRKPERLAKLDQPSIAANIGLRLIQVHLAMFYVMMGLTKLYGDAWWDGNAVWILLAQTESRPLDLTGLRRLGQPGYYLLNLWTHTLVYFELAFGVLIWNRYTRSVMLALSVPIWISLIIATGHVVFGLTMLAAGSAFLPFRKQAIALR
jgi:hypothetical protein